MGYNDYTVNKARGYTMSIRNLISIIKHVNWMRSYEEEDPIDINNLTQEDANTLYEHIDSGLSPENLHCDGEISDSEAMSKYDEYMGVVRVLQHNGFAIPEGCWECKAN